jgi:hypothetical protein
MREKKCFKIFIMILFKYFSEILTLGSRSGSIFRIWIQKPRVKKSAQIRIRNLARVSNGKIFSKTYVTVPFTVEEANSIEVAQSPSTHSRTTERFSVQALDTTDHKHSQFFVCLIVQNFAL